VRFAKKRRERNTGLIMNIIAGKKKKKVFVSV